MSTILVSAIEHAIEMAKDGQALFNHLLARRDPELEYDHAAGVRAYNFRSVQAHLERALWVLNEQPETSHMPAPLRRRTVLADPMTYANMRVPTFSSNTTEQGHPYRDAPQIIEQGSIVHPIDDPKTIHSCRCEMRSLLMHGCRCGGR